MNRQPTVTDDEDWEPIYRFDNDAQRAPAMANSYYSVYEHIVFSTKHREDLLTPDIAPLLFGYIAGGIRKQGCFPLTIGGMPNHVHILARKKSNQTTSDLIKEIKRASTAWLNSKKIANGNFHWQDGYGAFSISYWDLEKIKAYIANQAIHHTKMTWEAEFRKLLVKHGVEFDERYFLD